MVDRRGHQQGYWGLGSHCYIMKDLSQSSLDASDTELFPPEHDQHTTVFVHDSMSALQFEET